VVVRDRLYLRGRLTERTTDWYTQDARGNVRYFGEDTAELDRRVLLHKGWTPLEPGLLGWCNSALGLGSNVSAEPQMAAKGPSRCGRVATGRGFSGSPAPTSSSAWARSLVTASCGGCAGRGVRHTSAVGGDLEPGPEPAQIRAGDADRERVAERLRAHYAAGRLTLDELLDRTEQAHAAQTVAELQHALRGLPAAALTAPGPPSLPAARMSGRATAAMVLGILGLVVPTVFVLPILAIVFGITSRAEIAREPGLEGGGRASAGIVLGAVSLVVHAVILAVVLRR
jgi:uncharacterized protein DUF1707/uncharacterized protein DUF4190